MRLKPRVKRRPWRQIWLDQSDAAVLALREWSHDNKLRRTVCLTSEKTNPARRYLDTAFRAELADWRACFGAIERMGKRKLVGGSSQGAIGAPESWRDSKQAGSSRDRPTSCFHQSSKLRPEILSELRSYGVSLPYYVPSGFELVQVANLPQNLGKQFIYSDGLFNISLFYRFLRIRLGEQKQRSSVVDCGGAWLVCEARPHCQVICVADLPEEVLLRIIGSVR